MRKYSRFLYILCGLAVLFELVVLAAPVTATTNTSGAVLQTYNAGPSVLPGMLVELNPKDSKTVIPLTNNDAANMLGVVVPSNDAAIVLTPQSVSAQQVLVATSGDYNLLVNNQQGSIKPGDYLTVSALAGVAMKATGNQAQVVGRAVGNFGTSSNVLGTVSLKNSTGGSSSVSIGHTLVYVYLASNPLYHENSNNLPSFLSKTASTVADGPVSQVRVYLGGVLLLITIVITATMFYASVRNGIVAVGRNPLAKRAIGRSLVQTIIGGLIIFIAGLLGVYLILKL
jgi:hypothetical protein